MEPSDAWNIHYTELPPAPLDEVLCGVGILQARGRPMAYGRP